LTQNYKIPSSEYYVYKIKVSLFFWLFLFDQLVFQRPAGFAFAWLAATLQGIAALSANIYRH
jgi:hypothetical protein